MREKIIKVFFLFMTFGLVVLMFGSASGQQARNIIKLKKTGNCKKCFLFEGRPEKGKTSRGKPDLCKLGIFNPYSSRPEWGIPESSKPN